jgi:hypothetical protein
MLTRLFAVTAFIGLIGSTAAAPTKSLVHAAGLDVEAAAPPHVARAAGDVGFKVEAVRLPSSDAVQVVVYMFKEGEPKDSMYFNPSAQASCAGSFKEMVARPKVCTSAFCVDYLPDGWLEFTESNIVYKVASGVYSNGGPRNVDYICNYYTRQCKIYGTLQQWNCKVR